MHEVCTRYLASDVQADVLAWLGIQQRNYSASEFHIVELVRKQYTLCVLGATQCLVMDIWPTLPYS